MGLLGRRPIVATETLVIGKEANELEQVETGLIDALEDVQTVYRRDQFDELRETLRSMPVKAAMALTGLSRRTIFHLRSGPRAGPPTALTSLMERWWKTMRCASLKSGIFGASTDGSGEAEPCHGGGSSSAGGNTELAKDAFDVGRRSVRTDEEQFGNLAVGAAGGD